MLWRTGNCDGTLRFGTTGALILGALLLCASSGGCASDDGSTSAPDGGPSSHTSDGSIADGAIVHDGHDATTSAEAGKDAGDAAAAAVDGGDAADAGPKTRYTDLVDPLIGTGGTTNINCFPGAIRPWGMVSASPDTTSSTGTPSTAAHASGYLSEDDLIQGFTHTRLQGTSTPDQGSVLLMPVTGDVPAVIAEAGYRSTYDKSSETATPGYYAVRLTGPDVKVELTATKRGAFHRYTFQSAPSSGVGRVVLDLGHAMMGTPVTGAQLTVSGAAIEGYTLPSGRFSGPSNGGLKTYFSIVFDPAPTSIVTFSNGAVGPDATRSGTKIGAVAAFPVGANTQVHARVGISYVDVNGARNNRTTELPVLDFDAAKKAASDAWETELESVRFEGGTSAQRTIMATALYHSFVVPTLVTDADGRYRGYDAQIHSAAFDYHTNFSMWDSYRTVHPLVTLVRRDRQRDLSRSLIQMAREGGYFPRWAMGNGYPNITAGSPADVVVGESYLRGVDGFDPSEALDLMLKEIDNPPPPGHPHSGREGLADYLAKGYVPNGLVVPGVGSRVVVRTLEYNMADTAIANVARAIGRTSDAARADKWRKSYSTLWDPSTSVFRGKNADGTWVTPFDAMNASETLYYGANATQYSWLVPEDMAGYMALHGSASAMTGRLTTFFEQADKALSAGTSSQYYIHGNEPDVHAMFLFLPAGRPDLTQEWVDWAATKFYQATRSGIAGNEDAGTLSAWYVLSALGIYPVPASDLWLIGRPEFPRVDVTVAKGTLTILASGAGPGVKYVKSVKLNGVVLAHPWIHHADLAGGGVLEFEMSPTATTWGTDFGAP